MGNSVIHSECIIKTPSARYIDEFLKCKCSADMISQKLFPNSKEITESFAAYQAVRKYFWKKGFSPDDKKISLIAIGDGHTPRTAATFAYRTNWECFSVDPLLTERPFDIKRLFVRRGKIEDFYHKCDKAVIVAVHSHADLSEGIKSIRANEYAIVANPCCVKQEITGHDPMAKYKDYGIFSPCREMILWHIMSRDLCV